MIAKGLRFTLTPFHAWFAALSVVIAAGVVAAVIIFTQGLWNGSADTK